MAGRGTGTFYKHMSQVFEMYMELIQKKAKKEDGVQDDSTVKNAYKELGALINDLLDVLITEQECENYEQNFFEVWIQIFRTVVYLAQHGLADAKTVDLFTERFHSINPVYKEALYPDFHNAIKETLDQKNPQGLIAVFSSFFAQAGIP